MRRTGNVYIHDQLAGQVWEDESGFGFQYSESYLSNPVHGPVSLTLPLREKAYTDSLILPFFDGLIPEGWLLHLATQNWKLDQRDRMGLLLNACSDCIGAVSIQNNGK